MVATAKIVATGGVAFAAVEETFHRVESIERRFDNVEQSKGNQYQNMVELNRWFKKMDGGWEILKAFTNIANREIKRTALMTSTGVLNLNFLFATEELNTREVITCFAVMMYQKRQPKGFPMDTLPPAIETSGNRSYDGQKRNLKRLFHSYLG